MIRTPVDNGYYLLLKDILEIIQHNRQAKPVPDILSDSHLQFNRKWRVSSSSISIQDLAINLNNRDISYN